MLSYPRSTHLKTLGQLVDNYTDNVGKYYPDLSNTSYVFGYCYSGTVVVRTLAPNCPCLSILDCLQER